MGSRVADGHRCDEEQGDQDGVLDGGQRLGEREPAWQSTINSEHPEDGSNKRQQERDGGRCCNAKQGSISEQRHAKRVNAGSICAHPARTKTEPQVQSCLKSAQEALAPWPRIQARTALPTRVLTQKKGMSFAQCICRSAPYPHPAARRSSSPFPSLAGSPS